MLENIATGKLSGQFFLFIVGRIILKERKFENFLAFTIIYLMCILQGKPQRFRRKIVETSRTDTKKAHSKNP